MGICSYLGKCATQLILIAINCVLALGGALVLYVGIYMRHAGWVDVIQGYWSNIDDAVTALIVIGAVIIGLAVLGTLAALCRWRFGLCTYAIVVLLFLILFAIVAIAVFILMAKANDWSDKKYPAEETEETVKTDFDQVYCYAQGEYICNDASVSEALTMFAPELDTAIVALFENTTGGVNTLCDEYLSDYSQLESLCDGCDTAREFENYTKVFDWADSQCPRTNETLVYCGEFLATGSLSNITVGTAPYDKCRSEFLDLVEDYSLYMGIGSVLICLGALMIIIFTFCLRRRDQLGRNHTDLEDDPVTPSMEYPRYQYTKA
ncbi:Non-canonical poly(A) RNA polymerase [Phytophthora nicotianae]|nr:Non-canonical poly(A) RNA polymerase [Phytophthora nicotianae]